MQSMRRMKSAQSRQKKYCGILSTQKRSIPFRKLRPKRLKILLRGERMLEAECREAAKKDNSGGLVSIDGGATWQPSPLTKTDMANIYARNQKLLRKELARRARAGR